MGATQSSPEEASAILAELKNGRYQNYSDAVRKEGTRMLRLQADSVGNGPVHLLAARGCSDGLSSVLAAYLARQDGKRWVGCGPHLGLGWLYIVAELVSRDSCCLQAALSLLGPSGLLASLEHTLQCRPARTRVSGSSEGLGWVLDGQGACSPCPALPSAPDPAHACMTNKLAGARRP